MNLPPRFCPQCGGTLGEREHDGRLRPVCVHCGHIVYLNPLPSVAAILVREGRVLLVRRNIEPGRGLWSLPGGFIEASETTADAVVREVLEETGLFCRPIRLRGVQSQIGGFYGDVIVLCYEAEIVSGTPAPGGDAEEVGFFDSSSLPPIAFEIHRTFILNKVARENEIVDQ